MTYATFPLSSATRYISGTVRSSTTKSPIFGATVTFSGKTVFTSLNGKFQINNPDYVSALLNTSHSLYEPDSEAVTAPFDGEALDVIIELVPLAGPPPEVPELPPVEPIPSGLVEVATVTINLGATGCVAQFGAPYTLLIVIPPNQGVVYRNENFFSTYIGYMVFAEGRRIADKMKEGADMYGLLDAIGFPVVFTLYAKPVGWTEAPPPPAGDAVVDVVVTDFSTGNPIEGAVVNFDANMKFTDVSGMVSFTLVPNTVYSFTVEKEGYISFGISYTSPAGGSTDTETVSLSPTVGVPTDLWGKVIDAISKFIAKEVIITPPMWSLMWRTMYGREISDEEALAIVNNTAYWLSFLNVGAKSFTNIDLITGEPSDWTKITPWEWVDFIATAVIGGYALQPFFKGVASMPLVEYEFIGTRAVEGLVTKTPTAARGVLASISLGGGGFGLKEALLLAFVVSQMDFVGWGLGLVPTHIRQQMDAHIKSVRAGIISLDNAVNLGNYEEAYILAQQLYADIEAGRSVAKTAAVSFWEHFGYTFDDIDVIFDTLKASIDTYVTQTSGLVINPADIPETFTEKVTLVMDGDTVQTPSWYKIRLVGFDAHEAGTSAGVDETTFLRGLIEGKDVTFMVDPENKIDKYWRVLAVPFLGNQNVSLAMLAKFGASLLPETKYQKRHRYVDWDENKRAADSYTGVVPAPSAALPIPKFGKIKINTSPSNARIVLDSLETGFFTAETLDNVPVGTHLVSLYLPEYVDYHEEVVVKPDRDVEIYHKFVEPAEVVPVKLLTKADVENQFKIGVISEATARAKLLELNYDPTDVDNFIATWKKEMEGLPDVTPPDLDASQYITSIPWGAKIFIDGGDTGQATATTIFMKPDVEHTILLTAPYYENWQKTYTPVAGKNPMLNAIMTYLGG